MKIASIILIIGFLSIIMNQGIWIHNMKKTYYEDYSLLFNNLLNISIQRDDQDSLSVNLEKVDISLKKHLEEANLMLPYKLELCKNERIINTVGNYVEKADDYIYLSPRIAISDSLFLCCSAIIPSSFIIGKMKRINDISC